MSAPYVLAELSANHAGSLTRAMELVDAAAAAGASAIKLQTWSPGTNEHRPGVSRGTTQESTGEAQ